MYDDLAEILKDACEHADEALKVHQDLFDEGDMAATLEELLIDIRHWAEFHSIDLYAALDQSYIHYLEDKKYAN